ncbi:unnamed protein product [Pylaiella littoralis]
MSCGVLCTPKYVVAVGEMCFLFFVGRASCSFIYLFIYFLSACLLVPPVSFFFKIMFLEELLLLSDWFSACVSFIPLCLSPFVFVLPVFFFSIFFNIVFLEELLLLPSLVHCLIAVCLCKTPFVSSHRCRFFGCFVFIFFSRLYISVFLVSCLGAPQKTPLVVLRYLCCACLVFLSGDGRALFYFYLFFAAGTTCAWFVTPGETIAASVRENQPTRMTVVILELVFRCGWLR